MPVYRNPFHNHPLLRKGGAHENSPSGQRARLREELLDEAAEYLQQRHQQTDETADTQADSEPNSELDSEQTEREPSAPFSFIDLIQAVDLPGDNYQMTAQCVA